MQKSDPKQAEDDDLEFVELDKKQDKLQKLLEKHPNKVAIMVEISKSSKKLRSIKKYKYGFQ